MVIRQEAVLACNAACKLGSCTERQSIRRAVLEEAVLDLLRDCLMQPDAVAAFLTSMTREMNARRGAEASQRQRLEAERAALCRKLDGLYDTIAEGLRTPGLKEKLEALEARKAQLERTLSAPAPCRCGCIRTWRSFIAARSEISRARWRIRAYMSRRWRASGR
ncbi:hypothetical protein [Paracoccus sp. ME4]|uniref:hypothetical protein n=1 Tax=Paracoccus sp. ME4 TaxID=3138066 RepID=UPI00398ADBE7